jgi:hypothetical protein
MTITHRIDWMFESESLSSIVKSDSAKKVPIPYPSELATGYSEHLELPEGILLIRDTHNFTSQDLPSEISLGNFTKTLWSNNFSLLLPSKERSKGKARHGLPSISK